MCNFMKYCTYMLVFTKVPLAYIHCTTYNALLVYIYPFNLKNSKCVHTYFKKMKRLYCLEIMQIYANLPCQWWDWFNETGLNK